MQPKLTIVSILSSAATLRSPTRSNLKAVASRTRAIDGTLFGWSLLIYDIANGKREDWPDQDLLLFASTVTKRVLFTHVPFTQSILFLGY